MRYSVCCVTDSGAPTLYVNLHPCLAPPPAGPVPPPPMSSQSKPPLLPLQTCPKFPAGRAVGVGRSRVGGIEGGGQIKPRGWKGGGQVKRGVLTAGRGAAAKRGEA